MISSIELAEGAPFLASFLANKGANMAGTWLERGLIKTSITEGLAKTTLRKHSLAAIALGKSLPNRMTEMRPSKRVNQMAALDSTVRCKGSEETGRLEGSIPPDALVVPCDARLLPEREGKGPLVLEREPAKPCVFNTESASMEFAILAGCECCGDGNVLDGIVRGLELAESKGKRAFSSDDGVVPITSFSEIFNEGFE